MTTTIWFSISSSCYIIAFSFLEFWALCRTIYVKMMMYYSIFIHNQNSKLNKPTNCWTRSQLISKRRENPKSSEKKLRYASSLKRVELSSFDVPDPIVTHSEVILSGQLPSSLILLQRVWNISVWWRWLYRMLLLYSGYVMSGLGRERTCSWLLLLSSWLNLSNVS